MTDKIIQIKPDYKFNPVLELEDKIEKLFSEIIALVDVSSNAAIDSHFSDRSISLLSLGRTLSIILDKTEEANKVSRKMWELSPSNGANKNG